MVATLNGARTFTSVARMLGLGVDELDSLAATARPDAAGLTFLPYLDGERTPFLPDAHGALLGLTRQSMTPENLARAAVLALACVVASAIDGMVAAGLPVRDITILGGGARSSSLRKAVADLTGLAVSWPGASEFAALGAARQAAWALTGELPDWPLPRMVTTIGQNEGSWVRQVRQSHLWARDAVSELEGPRGRS
jgi:xylulokinase